jgi:hypothetical protein
MRSGEIHVCQKGDYLPAEYAGMALSDQMHDFCNLVGGC